MPGYKYSEQREGIFNEKGQILFIKVRDRVKALVTEPKAVRMDAILAGSYEGRDDWAIMACVDRLVELDEIRECKYGECAGQHRVFMLARQAM